MILGQKDKLELFKKIFPTVEIKSVSENQGAEHYILDINDLWICKISKNIESSGLEMEANLLKSLLSKLKTKIPIVEYYEAGFLIYKKIPGVELTNEIYEKLSKTQKDKLANDIAFFLHELHNSLNIVDAKKIGLIKNDWPWSPEKLNYHSFLIENAELKEIFQTFIKTYIYLRKEDKITLIHNDINTRNIIIDPRAGQLSGIIDFTDVALDDQYIDLRFTYMSIHELSESIAKNYANIANILFNIEKIYIYYMATEFSRYLEYIKEQKNNELYKINNRIISVLKILAWT